VGACRNIRFHPNGKQLLISGYRQGLEIWPIAQDANVPEKLRVGPPRLLPLPFEVFGFEVARDGRTVSVGSENPGGARILDLDTGKLRDVKFPHPDGHWAALSRDARWIATSGWQSPNTELWNAQTGELLLKLTGDHANLWFTPDGRELVVAKTDAYFFYDVGSKQITKRIERQGNMHPGWIAFTADGKLMALEVSAGLIRLCEVATGRTIAHLQDPSGGVSAWMDFSPDSTQLIVGAIHERAIHRWDLRAMRVELKAMGLDWDWPEFLPPPAEEQKPPHLHVELINTVATSH
jgi:WD40 repeat protein